MPTILSLAAWLLTAMGSLYGQENHRGYEDRDITEARYEEFALDVATAVSQPYVRPLFEGRDGRAKTGLLLVSIASPESSYKESVIVCEEGGDGNHSWGPFQAQIQRARVCNSVVGAAGVAIEMLTESFRVCQGMPLEERLALYTDGPAFRSAKAARRSRERMMPALEYWKRHPFRAAQ